MGSEIDDKRIAEIRARVEAATSGPWHPDRISFRVRVDSEAHTQADAAFIVAARDDVPDLLDAFVAARYAVLSFARFKRLDEELTELERAAEDYEVPNRGDGSDIYLEREHARQALEQACAHPDVIAILQRCNG